MNVILAILVLSIIVIIHEFGHFIIAKANGITVVEFSIGFGPKLIHFKKGETEYCLKLLPFGGACIMLGEDFIELNSGEDDESDDKEDENRGYKHIFEHDKADKTADMQTDSVSAGAYISQEMREKALSQGYDMEKSFANRSVWARIAVIAAGPVFNFLLAFVCAVVIIGSIGYDPCMVDVVYEDSPASQAGLKEGDRIVRVNGEKIVFYRDYSFYRYYHADKPMKLVVERDGERYETLLTPQLVKRQQYQVGIEFEDTEHTGIAAVVKDSPAQAAGMKAGDVIQSINGTAVDNYDQVSKAIDASGGQQLHIVVMRDGVQTEISVKPEYVETESYYTGFGSYGTRQKVSPLATIKYSFYEVGYSIATVIKSLGMMFTGQVGINDLSGPVGTVSIMSDIVEESKAEGTFFMILNLLNLAGLISANLGVMNLLPIPALDGGRLVFLIIEALRGKPVKKEHEGMVHFVGMILLMILMVYILFKDIVMLF